LLASFTSWSEMYSPWRMGWTQLERGQDIFSGGGDVGARHGRLVAGAHQLERAQLGVSKDAFAIHGDGIAVHQETQPPRLHGRSRDLGHGDRLEARPHCIQPAGLHRAQRLSLQPPRRARDPPGLASPM
jgi:hypothetical protein